MSAKRSFDQHARGEVPDDVDQVRHADGDDILSRGGDVKKDEIS